MTDAAAAPALPAGRPRSWAELRQLAGPLTAGQRWTVAFACGATALFLTAGLPGTRAVVDDSVTGSLEPAISAPAPALSAAIDSGAPVPAATFFNQPTPTTAPPTTSPTTTPSGSGGGGSDQPPPPPDGGSGGQPTQPEPLPIPVPLPVPIPGLGG